MKFLDQYFNQIDAHTISVSAEQGSDFAKRVAGDFNPIHDSLAKRFCVPGDLLFALALKKIGLSNEMSFRFLDLVSANMPLHYVAHNQAAGLQILNDKDKPVLDLQCQGDCNKDEQRIEQLLRKYVAFSGENFPTILVPLMEQHGVMINPKRPLVIYQNMSFSITDLDFTDLEISLEKTELQPEGKRGDANLYFTIQANGRKIGSGVKTLVLSGLREFDADVIQELTDAYLARRRTWQQNQ